MECCLVLIVFSPQLEHNVAFRAGPFGVLVLDSKVNGILVPQHVSFFTKSLLAQITQPSFQLHVNCVFVPLEAETSSESTLAHVAEIFLLLGVPVLGTNMPHEICYWLQAYRAYFLDSLMYGGHVGPQSLS